MSTAKQCKFYYEVSLKGTQTEFAILGIVIFVIMWKIINIESHLTLCNIVNFHYCTINNKSRNSVGDFKSTQNHLFLSITSFGHGCATSKLIRCINRFSLFGLCISSSGDLIL